MLRRAEDAYAEGRMDNHQVSLLDAAGWRGRTHDQVTNLLADLPLVTGIHKVVSWCREQDVTPYLATLAWEPVGQFLCKPFGFAGASGPRLAIQDGVYTGNVERHFDELDKRDIAIRKAADMGLPASACAAVGDSRSDLPLFADVGLSIAFNAGAALEAVAAACVSGPDLQAVIEPLARWLRVTSTQLTPLDLVRPGGRRAPQSCPQYGDAWAGLSPSACSRIDAWHGDGIVTGSGSAVGMTPGCERFIAASTACPAGGTRFLPVTSTNRVYPV